MVRYAGIPVDIPDGRLRVIAGGGATIESYGGCCGSRNGAVMNDHEVRLRLEQIRRGLLERQSRLASHVGHRETPLSAKFSDQAAELENVETMMQLAAHVQQEITEVEIALARLQNGLYSVCDACNGDIAAERLVALPTTSYCSACAPIG